MRTIQAKQILSSWSDGMSWFGSNYSINLYKGCCHGCIYCDSRSECYRVESFDMVRAKENALQLLEAELRSKRRKGIVANGAMSDPYNPFEEDALLTRGALELFHRLGYGASLLTKSTMITRDLDILTEINRQAAVVAEFTITHDDRLCKQLEPFVAPSSQRFVALKQIAEAGIFCGILLWPILSFINDSEENVRAIVRSAADSGASFVSPFFGVTLRQNQRARFYKQLDRLFPGVKERYIQTFGQSYQCVSPNKVSLWAAFTQECERYGLLYKMDAIRAAITSQQRSCNYHSLIRGK
ncbi:MAG: radical SAM protein [Firmicutes bacterium]|nr:radical SAM protein [Bacillota bacterium]